MKKFLSFLLFALCLTVAANAQTFATYDFEDGTIPSDFTNVQNEENYAWIVIDTVDDGGNAVRCIRSSNRGVASSTSAIEITHDFASDGYITFDALCMGEGTGTAWDRCIFYIDGEAQFTYGAHIAGWNHYSYPVTAGSHTFKWVYTKDHSLNYPGDAFFVDNIVFGFGTDPCEVPSNVTVSDITANSATVGWTGNSTEYNVHYRVPGVETDTVFFEDFEDADNFVDGLPNGWTSIDHDGDGYNWIYHNNYGLSSGRITSHSGVGVMYSQSYDFDAGALTPDNWLITPQIELGNIVKVWLTAQDPSYPDEHFAIYLSTTGNDVTDFTVTLLPKTKATGEYVEYTADLRAYAGQQGYIAIRHFNVTDEFYLNVDDFGVYNEELWTTITATGNTAELTDLAPETTYEVQVQGICESGMTEWTEPVMFTTEPAPTCVIDTIEIYGFTEPVYGEHPDYAMSVPDGAHYSIDYVDWNWWNVDEDNGDILGADEFFDNEDNVYYMYFQIIPEDGCTFADNVTVKVNGDENIIDFEYTGYDETDGFFWAYTVDFEVEAPACVITAVNVTGYESPVAGENSQDHLNITVLTVPEDANYSFYVSPRWYDDDADNSFYGIFDEGTHYSVGMTLEANSGCVFDDNCTFYVNGNTTLVDLDYSGVYSTPVKADVWTKSVAATGSTTEPCAVPSNLTATDITDNSATASWTGSQDNYNVRYIRGSIFEDFENGMPANWTTIDADGDGYNWTSFSNAGAESHMYAHSGDGIVYSESYDNDYGPLTPDNYLVSPQIELGGTVRFWACAQDASWAGEHFGLAVSTTGNSDPDDFTTIQEWTMTANKVGGNWHEYTVDLSAYAGQTGYVALRHFNCTDMFILKVDEFGVFLDDDWTTVTATDNFVDLTGLDPETPYIVQVQGICESGMTEWTEPVMFTTEPAPTCVINTIEITGFTEPVYGATPDFDVEVPADADYTLDNVLWAEYNREMTAETFVANWYFMVFDIAPNEGCIFADNLTVTINGDASLVDPDYGGILSDDYKYRVCSKDYVLSVPPCETPTNVTVSDITANSATVSWTGSLEEYNVLYGTNLINYRSDFETDESWDGWSNFDADGDGYNWERWTTFRDESHSGTSFLISRSYYNYEALDPDNWLITPTIDLGGTMSVWVRSLFDSDLENFAIYLTTNPDYEGVEDFNIELVGQTTAPYEWTEYTVDLSAYVGQRGAIAIRHFNSEDNFILLVDDFSVIDGTAMTATGNSIELTDLDPETTYEVQVQGICEYSVLSAWTEPEEFTTEAEPAPACEAPTGLAASNITATTAKLEWTGSQDQYTVRYKEDAASDWIEATTTNRFFALTSLTPATTYTAQVQGDCGTGAKVVTDWSEPVTFTTLSGTIEPGECGPAVDCEGTSYPTVKIGDVCWMAKNLAAETCVTTGNVYAYVNDQFPDEDANVETYGLLYDEEAAFATGICPEGYTLPTTEQFEYLKNNFTVEELRNSTGWVVNTGTNGTGFSWDGSGFYNGTSDNFEHMLMEGYLWAVDMTSGTPQPAMYKMMYYCNEIVRVYDFNGISASIRCVKNAEPQPEPQPEPETFRCGIDELIISESQNHYQTVQIGTQCWTKTNMREPVGEEVTFGNAEYPATEAYRFKVPSRDLAIYGYLYNWKAANMVCPTGWHLPTDAEWTQMENVVSTIPIDPDATGERGDHLGKLAAYDENWDPSSTPNTPGYTEPFDDRNLSGFSARPMGYYWRGFDAQTRYAQFWTATENPEDNTKAYDRWMGYLYTSVQRYSHSKTMGYSVRCLRDAEPGGEEPGGEEPTSFNCGEGHPITIGSNSYETVQIGTQCWTKTNMRETKDKNGTDFINGISAGSFDDIEDAVIYIPTEETWSENNSSVTYDENTFGYYYNWVAANNVCPDGWHLPSDEEWTQLEDYVSNAQEGTEYIYRCDQSDATSIAKALASETGWSVWPGECYPGVQSVNPNNATGFSAVPAGYCYGSSFYSAGNYAYFWSSTQDNSYYAYDRYLRYHYASVARYDNSKINGYSVRCLRDSE